MIYWTLTARSEHKRFIRMAAQRDMVDARIITLTGQTWDYAPVRTLGPRGPILDEDMYHMICRDIADHQDDALDASELWAACEGICMAWEDPEYWDHRAVDDPQSILAYLITHRDAIIARFEGDYYA